MTQRRGSPTILALLAVLLLASETLFAADAADKYPDSPLYSKPIEVAPGVWSAIGATQPPTYENSGHNNNLSFVIGDEGVLVVNGGGAYVLAEALHREIEEITDKPVLAVVDENGQGHAMLGNGYWKGRGVEIIAHEDAAALWAEEAWDILERMKAVNKDKARGTEVVMVDETFAERMTLDLGGVTAELIAFGPAHSAGDISVWLPELRLDRGQFCVCAAGASASAASISRRDDSSSGRSRTAPRPRGDILRQVFRRMSVILSASRRKTRRETRREMHSLARRLRFLRGTVRRAPGGRAVGRRGCGSGP